MFLWVLGLWFGGGMASGASFFTGQSKKPQGCFLYGRIFSAVGGKEPLAGTLCS